MEIIEKVKSCLVVIDKNVSEDCITFFENDSDKNIIVEKIRNFNFIISNMTNEDIDILFDKDFETELWPLISFCNN